MLLIKKLFPIMLVMSLVSVSSVFAAQYEEGIHYERVVPAQPTSTVDKVEILEIFWYGCPHCFRFEPFAERLLRKMPENSQFVRLPGIFRPSWENHARAFYTAELLGIFDKIHKPLFSAIHLEKRKMDSEEVLADFFSTHGGIDKAEFIKTFKSFAVETRLRRAKTMTSRYGIDGVPAVVVNGKYRVSARGAGSNAEMVKIIRYLADKENQS